MGYSGTIRVVVVLDSELAQEGLVTLLNREPDIEIVGEAHNGAGALAEVRRTAPDVVLMDVPISPFLPPLSSDRYADTELPRSMWIHQFTHEARRVVEIAQEEARRLNHVFVGAEHILLGLIREGEGIAAQALESPARLTRAGTRASPSLEDRLPPAPGGTCRCCLPGTNR